MNELTKEDKSKLLVLIRKYKSGYGRTITEKDAMLIAVEWAKIKAVKIKKL